MIEVAWHFCVSHVNISLCVDLYKLYVRVEAASKMVETNKIRKQENHLNNLNSLTF